MYLSEFINDYIQFDNQSILKKIEFFYYFLFIIVLHLSRLPANLNKITNLFFQLKQIKTNYFIYI